MPPLYHGTPPLSSLWRMLVFFLAKYETKETNFNYHRAVVQQILTFSFSSFAKSSSPQEGEEELTSFLENREAERLPVWLTNPFWKPQVFVEGKGREGQKNDFSLRKIFQGEIGREQFLFNLTPCQLYDEEAPKGMTFTTPTHPQPPAEDPVRFLDYPLSDSKFNSHL
jgi:hypothetical protein